MTEIKNIKNKLEKLIEVNRILDQGIIDSIKKTSLQGNPISRGEEIKIEIKSGHMNYIRIMNEAYEVVCEEFCIPYQPLKSGNLNLE